MAKSKKLAQTLKLLIQNQNWKFNDKLPSLRLQAEQSGLSLITVLNAYRELEAQGLIYAKEKSGYFVADLNSYTLKNEHIKKSVVEVPHQIEINSKVFHYLKSIQDEQNIPFGSAFPNSQLLYSTKLIQTLGQLAKHRYSYEQMPCLPPGNYELRKIIAQRYVMQGVQADASDIVITSGGLDALNLSLQAITQSGDYILLQQTVFYGAWQAAERLGLKVITIPEHKEHGLDLEAFFHAVEHYPIKVCLLMLNAQNPIGFTVSDENKKKLYRILHERHIHLIEDDVYEELYYDQKKPLAMKYLDTEQLVLHCSSFSKTLGSGFRVGWVYAGKYAEKIQHLQLMSTLSANPFIQNALVEYLSHRYYEKHLKNLRKALEHNKSTIFKFLKDHLPESCSIQYHASGYFLWLELPKHINSNELYMHMLSKHISIAPGDLFSAHSDKNNHHVRLNCSFGLSPSNEQALIQLIESIKQKILKQS
jgi:DNA-binding transcriptional MocR family regulator